MPLKKYDKQDQGKAAFNKRNPYPTQQQEPVARSPGGLQTIFSTVSLACSDFPENSTSDVMEDSLEASINLDHKPDVT
jgi:hypothetical protein